MFNDMLIREYRDSLGLSDRLEALEKFRAINLEGWYSLINL